VGNDRDIFFRIKNQVIAKEPNAEIILYGSYARGDNTKDSDIDILILLDKDTISGEIERGVSYPLFEIEFETGKIISPFVVSRKDWETRHRITPFYENVRKEGIIL
jgi:predicted nucleotidyltransferase